MDGIFGVGLPEMLIIALALFIVGGPKNTAKWARELGVYARKAREAWSKVMTEMETELGPEGKEVMDVARELSKGVNDVRTMNPARRTMSETLRLVGDLADPEDQKPRLPATTDSSTPAAPGHNGGADAPAQSPAKTTAKASAKTATVKADAKEADTKYPAWVPKDDSE